MSDSKKLRKRRRTRSATLDPVRLLLVPVGALLVLGAGLPLIGFGHDLDSSRKKAPPGRALAVRTMRTTTAVPDAVACDGARLSDPRPGSSYPPGSVARTAAVVDVLVVYTKTLAEEPGGPADANEVGVHAEALETYMDQTLENSNVDMDVRVVWVKEVDYEQANETKRCLLFRMIDPDDPESEWPDCMTSWPLNCKCYDYDPNDPNSDPNCPWPVDGLYDMHQWRDDVGADVVVMLYVNPNPEPQSLAYVGAMSGDPNSPNGEPNQTVALIDWRNWSDTEGRGILAHELGHVFGLGHIDAPSGCEALPFGQGYKWDGPGNDCDFVTMMDSGSPLSPPRIKFYSDPNVFWDPNDCNRPTGDPNHNAARALRIYADVIADLRDRDCNRNGVSDATESLTCRAAGIEAPRDEVGLEDLAALLAAEGSGRFHGKYLPCADLDDDGDVDASDRSALLSVYNETCD